MLLNKKRDNTLWKLLTFIKNNYKSYWGQHTQSNQTLSGMTKASGCFIVTVTKKRV